MVNLRCLFFFSLLGLSLTLQAKPLNVKVSAKYAVLINAETGEVLFEKESFTPAYPASTTKIATAVYALEALEKRGCSLNEKATVLLDCIKTVLPSVKHNPAINNPPYRLESDGTMMYIRAGEEVPLKSLFHGMMLRSGNDAANVLAHYVTGDINLFMKDLNQFLKTKGIKNTHFVNPSGLPMPDHITTAYDLALMAKELLKKPFLRETVKTVRVECPQTNKQPARELIQSNRLLKPGAYYYPKAIGIKSGYTHVSALNFVSAATHEGRTLISVLLGCENREQMYRETIKLFETAFAEKPVIRTLFSRAHDHFPISVKGAKVPLDAVLNHDLILHYFPAEEPKFSTRIRCSDLKLPVAQGGEVGKLELVTERGEVLQSAPLLATRSLEKTSWQTFSDGCTHYRKTLICSLLILNILGALYYYFKKSMTSRRF